MRKRFQCFSHDSAEHAAAICAAHCMSLSRGSDQQVSDLNGPILRCYLAGDDADYCQRNLVLGRRVIYTFG